MSRFSQFTGGGGTTGQVAEFINNSNPAGYLQLNGQCVCKSTYSSLYSVLGDQEPPITDSLNMGPIAQPTGYNCICLFDFVSNCSCIVNIGVFHCHVCCAKIATRLCYVTSSGVCGFVDDSSGGCFNSYYSSWNGAPCSPYAISLGYDCNTCKLYAAIFYTITMNPLGGFCCCNYVKVFNLTDCILSSACYFYASCYYNQEVRSFCNTCLLEMGCIGCGSISRICYPTASFLQVLNRSSIRIYPPGCATYTSSPLNNIFNNASGGLPIYSGQGRNPIAFIGERTNVCYCFGYSCCCYVDGITAIDVVNSCATLTSLGCSGSLLNLMCCACGAGSGGIVAQPAYGRVFQGFYCDSLYIGTTNVYTAGYCICCYGQGQISWDEPGKYNIRRALVCKNSIFEQAVFCTVVASDIITLTFNQCIGPSQIIYVPKCNMYHVNKRTLALVPCCHNCSSPSVTCSLMASGPLPVNGNSCTNCLGLNFVVSDSTTKYRANTVPHTYDGGNKTLTIYGQSTLGPNSSLFLIPNVSHPVNGIKYFIKT